MLDARIELRDLNALIGANGAGKSNFIRVMELLGRLVDHELQYAVERDGGASALLHQPTGGREMSIEVEWAGNSYIAVLEPTADNRLIFSAEFIRHQVHGLEVPVIQRLGGGHRESALIKEANQGSHSVSTSYIANLLSGCRVFHFHDTSRTAAVKAPGPTADNLTLQSDARNLAAVLWTMRRSDKAAYRRILGAVRQVAPFFRDFVLEPEKRNDEIRVRWRQIDSDTIYSAFQMSDGTLRFICLATLLLQSHLPQIIVLDEPELGLHPYAVVQLADMLQAAAASSQVIIATQSVTLMDQLELENLIVVERESGASEFIRPDPEYLAAWLDEYSLGEIWQKNLIGGRPKREV
jgi:predicted ATPase